MVLAQALRAIILEYNRADSEFPPYNSYHEGYAVLKEEVDELWDEIKHNPRNTDNVRNEATQCAAVALRFLVDLCDIE